MTWAILEVIWLKYLVHLPRILDFFIHPLTYSFLRPSALHVKIIWEFLSHSCSWRLHRPCIFFHISSYFIPSYVVLPHNTPSHISIKFCRLLSFLHLFNASLPYIGFGIKTPLGSTRNASWNIYNHRLF